MIGTAPEGGLDRARSPRAGGSRKPRYGQVAVCYAGAEAEARHIAHEWWPTRDSSGNLALGAEDAGALRACGREGARGGHRQVDRVRPKPRSSHREDQSIPDAGYDHVYVHQVGPDQDGFFRFYEEEVLPEFR